ncbi:hypothetical protein PYW07_011294 [Mythimna separata]|uniref:Fatty acyl-CoA reductase n=1 Tax=Mythimna separata TaxID=271217 RepID=A0AAD7Y935_MYTSE|nr:hypothetical protein PYW07_011294 [Mythimna separata]
MVVTESSDGPLLPRFYAGRSVLITGGSGFLGKVLIERLLATCPDVHAVLLLMRDKRGHEPLKRLAELKQSQCFDNIRATCPGQLDKLRVVSGDVAKPRLGLDDAALTQLQEVSVVFHNAATIKFWESLETALHQNVTSVVALMDLCDQLPKLEALIHVSTAYSNAEHQRIEERVYDAPVTLDSLRAMVDALPPALLNDLTASRLLEERAWTVCEPWWMRFHRPCSTTSLLGKCTLQQAAGGASLDSLRAMVDALPPALLNDLTASRLLEERAWTVCEPWWMRFHRPCSTTSLLGKCTLQQAAGGASLDSLRAMVDALPPALLNDLTASLLEERAWTVCEPWWMRFHRPCSTTSLLGKCTLQQAAGGASLDSLRAMVDALPPALLNDLTASRLLEERAWTVCEPWWMRFHRPCSTTSLLGKCTLQQAAGGASLDSLRAMVDALPPALLNDLTASLLEERAWTVCEPWWMRFHRPCSTTSLLGKCTLQQAAGGASLDSLRAMVDALPPALLNDLTASRLLEERAWTVCEPWWMRFHRPCSTTSLLGKCTLQPAGGASLDSLRAMVDALPPALLNDLTASLLEERAWTVCEPWWMRFHRPCSTTSLLGKCTLQQAAGGASLDSLRAMVDALPPALLNDLTARFISPKPNTYTFSKALAESMIDSRPSRHYSAAIVRPSEHIHNTYTFSKALAESMIDSRPSRHYSAAIVRPSEHIHNTYTFSKALAESMIDSRPSRHYSAAIVRPSEHIHNTYTFSKALAESMIDSRPSRHYSAAIVRPSEHIHNTYTFSKALAESMIDSRPSRHYSAAIVRPSEHIHNTYTFSKALAESMIDSRPSRHYSAAIVRPSEHIHNTYTFSKALAESMIDSRPSRHYSAAIVRPSEHIHNTYTFSKALAESMIDSRPSRHYSAAIVRPSEHIHNTYTFSKALAESMIDSRPSRHYSAAIVRPSEHIHNTYTFSKALAESMIDSRPSRHYSAAIVRPSEHIHNTYTFSKALAESMIDSRPSRHYSAAIVRPSEHIHNTYTFSKALAESMIDSRPSRHYSAAIVRPSEHIHNTYTFSKALAESMIDSRPSRHYSAAIVRPSEHIHNTYTFSKALAESMIDSRPSRHYSAAIVRPSEHIHNTYTFSKALAESMIDSRPSRHYSAAIVRPSEHIHNTYTFSKALAESMIDSRPSRHYSAAIVRPSEHIHNTYTFSKALAESMIDSRPSRHYSAAIVRPSEHIHNTYTFSKALAESMIDSRPSRHYSAAIVRPSEHIHNTYTFSKALAESMIDSRPSRHYSAAIVRPSEHIHNTYTFSKALAESMIDSRPSRHYSAAIVRPSEHIHNTYTFSKALAESMIDSRPSRHYSAAIVRPSEHIHNTYTFSKALAESMIDSRPSRHYSAAIVRPSEHIHNTYTFSKALAESMIDSRPSRHYSAAIVRPSVVVSSHRDPYPGWIENLAGPSGVVVGCGKGLLHAFPLDHAARADLVPVDITIDTMLAVAWEIATDKSPEVRVYNSSSQENPVTWGTFRATMVEATRVHPFSTVLYYPFIIGVKNSYVYKTLEMLLQTAPLYVANCIAKACGVKLQLSLVTAGERIQAMNRVLAFFATREWEFQTDNVQRLRDRLSPQDRLIYNLDVRVVNWEEHIFNFVKGTRKYLLKEKDDNRPQAKKHMVRLRFINNVVLLLLTILVYRFITLIIRNFVL